MHPIRKLYEDHADVLRHGEKHFAEVFHLSVLYGAVLHSGELCNALYDIRNILAEFLFQRVVLYGGVFEHIMQQRGNDRVVIQSHLCGDGSSGDGVRDVRRTVLAVLPVMGGNGVVKGAPDTSHVGMR